MIDSNVPQQGKIGRLSDHHHRKLHAHLPGLEGTEDVVLIAAADRDKGVAVLDVLFLIHRRIGGVGLQHGHVVQFFREFQCPVAIRLE